MISVSVVEVHAVQRIGLQALLESDASITVSDTAKTWQDIDGRAADVLLLSYCAVCDLPPTALVAELAEQHRVVVYSGKESPVSLLAYENTNVQALLHQSDPDERLFNSICAANAGDRNLGSRTGQPVAGLSKRESLVLALVGDGYTNDQIARRIGISKHTVDTYLRRIRSKLNLGNKAQLARAAFHYSQTRPLPQEPSRS